ncbi:hypothetical protein [Helicobacter canis]|uniref:hypothetical protein n=1 Tax=Helicobacter canis TaxID=29419 RepID=UPI0015F06351|nr:hypothetical protein [Helicobacter canis]
MGVSKGLCQRGFSKAMLWRESLKGFVCKDFDLIYKGGYEVCRVCVGTARLKLALT